MTAIIEGPGPELKQVGHSVKRLDGWEKVTGQAHYAADLQFTGMLYARLVTSPYAHAKITKIDASAALEVPGVVRVVTAADLPLVKDEDGTRKRNPLADNEVIFYGQPVAVVLGETEAAATDGAALVDITYEPLPVVLDLLDAIKPGAPLVRLDKTQPKENETSPNISNRIPFKQGDIEQGFKEADVIVENTYRLPMVHQGYIETHSCIAAPDPLGGVTLYPSSQALFLTRREVAQALNLPVNKVKVVLPHIGGGFGGKNGVLLEPLCAALALVSKRPVHLSFDRMEDFAAANPMPHCIIEVKTGAKQDGKLTAMQARLYFDTGAYGGGSPAWLAGLMFSVSYRIPHYDVEAIEIMTNRVGGGAYRAPGGPQAIFAIESQVDMLARKLGLDSLEMHLRNGSLENPLFGPIVQKLQSSLLWQNRHTKGPNEGYGLAFANHATATGPASALCRLDSDGDFSVITGVADVTGVSTSLALIAAETLGTTIEHIRIINADSDSAPQVGPSGGSQMTHNLGGAVRNAAEEARLQILRIAADELEANDTDLELIGSQISVKGAPSRSVSLQKIAEMSTADYEGKCMPVLGQGRHVTKELPITLFAHLAHVKVDPETGEVAILDYLAIHDVGFAINPAEVEGQLHGGITQGLGWALYEQLVYNESGTLVSGSMMDYAIQTAPMVPKIQTELVFVPDKTGPFGAKGIGEPPIVPGAAAIANAIFDATGARLTELPATPERVLKALGG